MIRFLLEDDKVRNYEFNEDKTMIRKKGIVGVVVDVPVPIVQPNDDGNWWLDYSWFIMLSWFIILSWFIMLNDER